MDSDPATPLSRQLLEDFSTRPQVAAVARELVRLIHTGNLRAGDRLPSQAELRAQMGFHNNTLNAAMAALVASGVVTRKRKRGTVVVEPDNPVRGLWRVGLAVIPATGEQAYWAQLLHFAQTYLDRVGCTTTPYILAGDDMGRPFAFQQLPHLVSDLERGRLDGVLTLPWLDVTEWAHWSRKQLALVHAGAWEDAPCGAIIEQGRMVETAVALLVRRGCERLAVVNTGSPFPGYARFWTGFRRGLQRAGHSTNSCRPLFGGDGPLGGRRVAEQLLTLPPAERPDGLIVINDRVAMGLTATLAAAGRYRPVIVAQTNQQAPLAFALPVIRFELAVDDLARQAVALLMQRLRNPALPLQREWVYPRLNSETPGYLPTPAPTAEEDLVLAESSV